MRTAPFGPTAQHLRGAQYVASRGTAHQWRAPESSAAVATVAAAAAAETAAATAMAAEVAAVRAKARWRQRWWPIVPGVFGLSSHPEAAHAAPEAAGASRSSRTTTLSTAASRVPSHHEWRCTKAAVGASPLSGCVPISGTTSNALSWWNVIWCGFRFGRIAIAPLREVAYLSPAGRALGCAHISRTR